MVLYMTMLTELVSTLLELEHLGIRAATAEGRSE
jgi:hypothetical protein